MRDTVLGKAFTGFMTMKSRCQATVLASNDPLSNSHILELTVGVLGSISGKLLVHALSGLLRLPSAGWLRGATVRVEGHSIGDLNGHHAMLQHVFRHFVVIESSHRPLYISNCLAAWHWLYQLQLVCPLFCFEWSRIRERAFLILSLLYLLKIVETVLTETSDFQFCYRFIATVMILKVNGKQCALRFNLIYVSNLHLIKWIFGFEVKIWRMCDFLGFRG